MYQIDEDFLTPYEQDSSDPEIQKLATRLKGILGKWRKDLFGGGSAVRDEL